MTDYTDEQRTPIALGRFYTQLLNIGPGMFHIFPFEDRDHLERLWDGICQHNPLALIERLSDVELGRLFVWALDELGEPDSKTLGLMIAAWHSRQQRTRQLSFWERLSARVMRRFRLQPYIPLEEI